jgi:hypothetical protein
MRIEKISSAPFRAKFINNIEAKKLVEGCYPCYERCCVKFTKVDPLNDLDINALSNAAISWKYSEFSESIYHAACAIRNESKYYKNHVVYALTEQEKVFEKLNSEKLLGLVHVSPNGDGYTLIEHIEVNPKYINSNEPKYTSLGTAMLNSLKQIYDKISCYPLDTIDVINFYLKNGFVKQPEKFNYYTYSK